jgi:putative membrane protein
LQWYGALALMSVVSGWPFHDIGEQSLYTVHMVEHMVLTLVVPPLMLMGTPRWLADLTLGHPKIAPWLKPLSRAVPAFVLFNAAFIVVHWPDMVEAMLTSEPAHFTLHAVLFGTATLMWMPVLSPTLALSKLSRPMQMLYLFLQSLLPTIPASFLTFSSVPIYPVYGDASWVWGLSPVADQTIAGIVMKLGGGLLIWATIAVFAGWKSTEVTIRVGDDERRGPMFEVLATIGEYAAGGMRVTPGASPEDGLFDVLLIGDVTKADFVRTFPKIYRGRHVSHPKIDILRGPAVTIDAAEPLPVALDCGSMLIALDD